jgi:hypothetical protein
VPTPAAPHRLVAYMSTTTIASGGGAFAPGVNIKGILGRVYDLWRLLVVGDRSCGGQHRVQALDEVWIGIALSFVTSADIGLA